MLSANHYEKIVDTFRTTFTIRKNTQVVSPNTLINVVKIYNFRFRCAPADFIEEVPVFRPIQEQRACISAQIRPLVRKYLLEALTGRAFRGYSFNRPDFIGD
jgi:hypothetical protein